jgi:hypothetical protein
MQHGSRAPCNPGPEPGTIMADVRALGKPFRVSSSRGADAGPGEPVRSRVIRGLRASPRIGVLGLMPYHSYCRISIVSGDRPDEVFDRILRRRPVGW